MFHASKWNYGHIKTDAGEIQSQYEYAFSIGRFKESYGSSYLGCYLEYLRKSGKCLLFWQNILGSRGYAVDNILAAIRNR